MSSDPQSTNQYDEDAVAITRVQRGSPDAFAALVERYYTSVYLTGLAVLKSHESAEDLAQEAFVRAFLNLGRLREPKAFARWLLCGTRNLALDWAKSAARWGIVFQLPELHQKGSQPTERPPGETIDARRTAERLKKALDTLPTAQSGPASARNRPGPESP